MEKRRKKGQKISEDFLKNKENFPVSESGQTFATGIKTASLKQHLTIVFLFDTHFYEIPNYTSCHEKSPSCFHEQELGKHEGLVFFSFYFASALRDGRF